MPEVSSLYLQVAFSSVSRPMVIFLVSAGKLPIGWAFERFGGTVSGSSGAETAWVVGAGDGTSFFSALGGADILPSLSAAGFSENDEEGNNFFKKPPPEKLAYKIKPTTSTTKIII